tara:strand:- start:75 stop:290 length:216 start_codon:yes stop_codon:yes gene_type:complete
MADHDITRMTSNVTNVAIAILCELQAAKEDNVTSEVVEKYERPAYFGRTHTRVADFKRLLVACTKLVVNES